MTDQMQKVEAPKRTGKPAESITFDILTGKLFPWDERRQQPVLLNMPSSPYQYLACFSTEEKLRKLLDDAEVSFDRIKCIDDGGVFMGGLLESAHPEQLKIILDPYFTSEGKIRFTQLFLDGDA